jgi:DNA polymerase elongation subunit (family B)
MSCWRDQEVRVEVDRGIETVTQSYIGRFAIPIKNPLNSSSSTDLVAMVATVAAVISAKSVKTAPSQQQLVEVKKPSPPQQQSSLVPLPLKPLPTSLVEKVPALGKFAVFDCEWYRDDLKENQEKGIAGDIYAFCLVDGHGSVEKLHVNHFTDRREFMSTILDVLGRYDTLAGYSILNSKKGGKEFVSDLGHIVNSCKQVGLSEKHASIECNVLDVYKIYHNETVDGFLKAAYKISYRGESLDVVTKAFLGKGKPEGVSGINVESLPPSEQLSYCFQDTQLCYELLQQKGFELLHILYEISQEIKLPFFDTCNVQWPTKWWNSKLASIEYQKVPTDVQRWIGDNTVWKSGSKKGVVAMGGYVFTPRTGYYVNAICYDVASMYPSMINIHNISTETINCSCCKDDPNARIPSEVMENINAHIMDKKNEAKKQEPRPWHYWICQKQRGQLSDVMKYLIERKIEYKKSGQTLKEKALKILMNSGYGCFKQPYFDYQDPRVAELITAYG